MSGYHQPQYSNFGFLPYHQPVFDPFDSKFFGPQPNYGYGFPGTQNAFIENCVAFAKDNKEYFKVPNLKDKFWRVTLNSSFKFNILDAIKILKEGNADEICFDYFNYGDKKNLIDVHLRKYIENDYGKNIRKDEIKKWKDKKFCLVPAIYHTDSLIEFTTSAIDKNGRLVNKPLEFFLGTDPDDSIICFNNYEKANKYFTQCLEEVRTEFNNFASLSTDKRTEIAEDGFSKYFPDNEFKHYMFKKDAEKRFINHNTFFDQQNNQIYSISDYANFLRYNYINPYSKSEILIEIAQCIKGEKIKNES